jgi:hypothetical protein
VFSSTGFAEEGIERVIASPDRLVAWHLAIGLDSMFKTVQLPTSVADLNTGLTNMD